MIFDIRFSILIFLTIRGIRKNFEDITHLKNKYVSSKLIFRKHLKFGYICYVLTKS